MPGQMIPYKSSNEMILSVDAGPDPAGDLGRPPAIPQIKGGKVKALAVTGRERSAELPDVPSMAEAGYPEVNTKLWSGYFVALEHAAGDRRQARSRRCARRSRIRTSAQSSRRMAVTPGGNSSAEFRAMIDEDIKSYCRRDQGREPEVRELVCGLA